MSNIEAVSPVVEDGIEFYVTSDGKQRGVSQRGSAKLAGVDESTIRRLITSFSVRHDLVPKELEHLIGVDLYCGMNAVNNAKVIDSKIVASIVSYFAFQKQNQIAIYSAQKFLSIGIDNWIDKVVGVSYNQPGDITNILKELNDNMGKLMVKMEVLERIEQETLGYRKATVSLPVLEKWMAELNEIDKKKLLEPSEELFTIREALAIAFKGTTFSQTQVKQVSLKVGQTINALTDSPNKKKNTPNGNGYGMVVNAYTRQQIPLIKLCMQTIIAGN